jgi:hypothetical protein
MRGAWNMQQAKSQGTLGQPGCPWTPLYISANPPLDPLANQLYSLYVACYSFLWLLKPPILRCWR